MDRFEQQSLDTSSHIDESQKAPGISRRRFITWLVGGGLASASLISIGIGIGQELYDDTEAGSEAHIPSATSTSLSQETPSSTTSPAPVQETVVAGEIKTSYSVAELAEYATNTVFAEEDVTVFHNTIDAIRNAPSLDESKAALVDGLKRITGRDLTFNVDPSTDMTLPNTRRDEDVTSYQLNLAEMYGMIAVMPKNLVDLPTRFNLVEDYFLTKTSEGVDTVDLNIAGMAHNGANTHILSLDYGYASDMETFCHELMHIAQGRDADYTDGTYAKMRQKGLEEFGSVTNMLVHLQEIAPSISEEAYNTATRLILAYGAEPDARYEDAAYNITGIFSDGLLPPSTDALLQNLRAKQLQALADMSAASGTDFAATFAYWHRFKHDVHPVTLRSMNKSGILNKISPIENSVFGPNEHADVFDIPGNGSYFINIGSAETPEVIILNSIVRGEDSYNVPQDYYKLSMNFPKTAGLTDLNEVPETTTTVPVTNESVTETTVNYAETMQAEYPQVGELIGIFAPELRMTGEYEIALNDDANYDVDPTIRLFVTLTSNAVYYTLDRNRIVGFIDESGLYQTN